MSASMDLNWAWLRLKKEEEVLRLCDRYFNVIVSLVCVGANLSTALLNVGDYSLETSH